MIVALKLQIARGAERPQRLSVFVHSAFIYGEMLRVVERNPEINKPSQIHSWYERNYGAICSSLRRMVDRSSDGASLRPPQPSERSLVVRARAVDGRRKRRLDPGENAGIG